jgi:hypothetical protein
VNHISIVTCNSAGDAGLTPSVIISRESTAFYPTLEATERAIGKHFISKHHAKRDINSGLFENHIRTVFLFYLAMSRIMQNIGEAEPVRLMDNCSPHHASLLPRLIFSRIPVCASLLLRRTQSKSSKFSISISPCVES